MNADVSIYSTKGHLNDFEKYESYMNHFLVRSQHNRTPTGCLDQHVRQSSPLLSLKHQVQYISRCIEAVLKNPMLAFCLICHRSVYF